MNPIRTLSAALVTAILVPFSMTPDLPARCAGAESRDVSGFLRHALSTNLRSRDPGKADDRQGVGRSEPRCPAALAANRDPAYRDKAQELFARAVSDPQFSLKDFHVLHHFGELAWAMKHEKLLGRTGGKPVLHWQVRELNAFCDSRDDDDNNIRIGQVAGYAGLRNLLAGTPLDRQAEIDRRFNATGRRSPPPATLMKTRRTTTHWAWCF